MKINFPSESLRSKMASMILPSVTEGFALETGTRVTGTHVKGNLTATCVKGNTETGTPVTGIGVNRNVAGTRVNGNTCKLEHNVNTCKRKYRNGKTCKRQNRDGNAC